NDGYKRPLGREDRSAKMGKDREWHDEDTIQLCLSWLEISEDPVTSTGQKKDSFFSRVYQH
ncbi:hypothetical protein L917_19050, partial [Phytophthora nicotianae]